MSHREPVAITGIGAVTAAGAGLLPLLSALEDGHCFVRGIGEPWARPPHDLGARVTDFGAASRISTRNLRRMGRLSRMAVVAAIEALEGAGLAREACAGVGTVIGTGLGALQDTVELLGQLLGSSGSSEVSPALFPSSVMNVAAAHISIELGLHGYSTTVNSKEVSGELALITGADVLARGHACQLLAGGVDELSEPVHHGYRRLGALAAAGPPRPFGRGRDGLALGEGACLLLLEPLSRARARGASVMGLILGAAASGGVRPLVGWGPSWEGGRLAGPDVEASEEAMRVAISEAGLAPADVGLVVGSACGSPDLDHLEAEALRRVFAGSTPVVTSLHGALGTWMASGSLRVAAAAGALARGCAFPAVGSAGALDEALAPAGLARTRTSLDADVALVCGHATGGGCAALVVGRGEI